MTASAMHQSAALDDPQAMRVAGRELLSLALIDARNHLLRALALDESPAALQLALRAGCYADYWICRHIQRGRGEACDARAPRLAGIEPRADAWIRGEGEGLNPDTLRAYLAETLEITLDLLSSAGPDDASLHFYRQTLLHEDRLTEALAVHALAGSPPSRAERAPLWLPAQRALIGSQPGPGLVPGNERWAHEVVVPEFEIDAQVVNWARYIEFVEDGGYDRPALWTAAGWQWVQQHGRRAPAQVEQMHGAVLVQRRQASGVELLRVPTAQPVMHTSRFEAEAWCRWAGRRLPTEPEWEIAARSAAGQGWVQGDVFEWVAGSARDWPGADPVAPGSLDTCPQAERPLRAGVLRGGSFATRRRRVYAQARRYAVPGRDTMFCGFRSCST